MKIAPALALCLPLALLPGLAGCYAVVHAERAEYEEVMEVVVLRNATAAEVAQTLADAAKPPAHSDGRWTPVSIAVDERTNSLVLRGQRARLKELKRAIAELDRAM